MLLGISLVLISAFLWSASFILRKRGLEEVDYKVFIVIRLSVGLIFTGVLLWSVGPGFANLTFSMVLPFVITGVIGNVFALIANTMAIHEIGASRTHALTSASPLVTAFLGAAFLGEKLTVNLFVGLIIIIIGGGVLSYRIHRNQSVHEIDRPVFGFSLALYSTVAIGTFTVLQKYGLNMGVTPLQGLFVRFLTAAVLYGIYLVVTRTKLDIKSSYRSPSYLWASILMTGAALMILIALAELPATLVAGLKRTAPLFTVILSVFWLKGIEKVDWKTFVIAGAIVAGAILVIMA